MPEAPESARLRRGSCLCGKVKFVTSGPLREVVACHCHQCRKQTGHYFAATDVADDHLTVEDAGTLKWYQSSQAAKRGFCSHCGSVLFWKLEGDPSTAILAGAFDEPTGLKLTSHIFVADKGDYYDIKDGLPQYAKSSDSVKVASP